MPGEELHLDADELSLDAPLAAPAPSVSPGKRLSNLLERVVKGVEHYAPLVLPIAANRRVAGAFHVGDCSVRYYRHWPDDAALLADWDALARSVPDASAFQSPLWQRGAARVADAVGRLRVVTVHHGHRLIAVAPLERTRSGHWQTLGQFITPYDHPLVHPDHADRAWDALFRGLLLIDPDLQSVTFSAIPPDHACVTVAPPIARAAGYTGGSIPTHLVTVPADLPDTWEAYVASLKRNTRSKVRSRVKKIDESPRVQFVVADTEPAVLAVLPGLLDLMQRDGGVKGRRTRWLFRPHLKRVAGPLARQGRLTVHHLLIDGELAAGLINLPTPTRELMWNTAMDDRFREWSPGYALNALSIRYTIRQGRRQFDFLRGMMDYKKELGGVAKPMHRLRFRR